MVLGLPQQRRHMLIVDRVIHCRPVPPRLHHSSVTEEAELVGHGGLGDGGDNGQITDAELPGAQRVEDAGTGRIAEDVEGFDDEQQQLVAWDRRSCLGHRLCMNGDRKLAG